MRINPAEELEAKRVIVSRIVSHLPQVPPNGANELMQESVGSLEEILSRLAAKSEREQIERDAQAQIEEMERDERVIMMGEDIAIYRSGDLVERFGPKRIWAMPISETSFSIRWDSVIRTTFSTSAATSP